jgi:hypothetical protein
VKALEERFEARGGVVAAGGEEAAQLVAGGWVRNCQVRVSSSAVISSSLGPKSVSSGSSSLGWRAGIGSGLESQCDE